MTPSQPVSASLRRRTDGMLAEACLATLAALRALQEALDLRDAAVAEAARRSGCSVRKTGHHIRATLAAAGFTEEEIAVLGVSDGNVRLICQRK